jgi:hypothetical protein
MLGTPSAEMFLHERGVPSKDHGVRIDGVEIFALVAWRSVQVEIQN